MPKHRLRFTKSKNARYISHLDLMRTFQRAFLRAGLEIRHTEGFNPHAYISVALPLSLGFESACELLDFECKGDVPLNKLPAMLNAVLPEGIEVMEAYEGLIKFAGIFYQQFRCVLMYDNGLPEGSRDKILELFAKEHLVVLKKGKKGEAPFDLIPCIKSLTADVEGASIVLDTVVTAQNPALNPQLLIRALEDALPDEKPSFVTHKRLEVFDKDMRIFR